MTDFERIRDSVLGYLTESERVPWAEDISREGTDYDAAYQKLLNIRERLCSRFGIDSDDEDLEAIIDAALQLEKAVAQGIFDAALTYAAQNHQP